jgi:hypothetical protein
MNVSEKVKTVCVVEGISEAELRTMVQLSSPLRGDDRANHRFHTWAFFIDKDTQQVTNMCRFGHTSVGHGRSPQLEECEHCQGEGCKDCGWRGEVVRLI